MELWLFFTIFGLVLFVPTLIILLILQRFRKTILVIIKKNGTITKVIINDKILSKGYITEIKGQKIKPIRIEQNEIRYGSVRRWIIKDLENEVIRQPSVISDSEIEAYLNSETINMLLLFGKLKDMLFLLLYIIIGVGIIGAGVNGYLIASHQTILQPDNQTMQVINVACKQAFNQVLNNSYGGFNNVGIIE